MPERKPRNDGLDVFGITHTGLVRRVNQDHFLVAALGRDLQILQTSVQQPLPQLTVIPGMPEMERAAFVAVVVDPNDTEAVPAALEQAARQSHAEILRRAADDPARAGMATTLTLWIGVWPRAYLLQIGCRFPERLEAGVRRLAHR